MPGPPIADTTPSVRVPLVFACVVLAGCGAEGPAGDGGGRVERVVDGDTVDVVIGQRHERVRLIGIDTPELAHAATGDRPATPGECYGEEARAYTEGLLPPGTRVRLVRDIVGRDDYGRVLAYVYRAADGVFVNYELARHGFAQPLAIPPNTAFATRFVEAVREAEAAGAGLWLACDS